MRTSGICLGLDRVFLKFASNYTSLAFYLFCIVLLVFFVLLFRVLSFHGENVFYLILFWNFGHVKSLTLYIILFLLLWSIVWFFIIEVWIRNCESVNRLICEELIHLISFRKRCGQEWVRHLAESPKLSFPLIKILSPFVNFIPISTNILLHRNPFHTIILAQDVFYSLGESHAGLSCYSHPCFFFGELLSLRFRERIIFFLKRVLEVEFVYLLFFFQINCRRLTYIRWITNKSLMPHIYDLSSVYISCVHFM